MVWLTDSKRTINRPPLCVINKRVNRLLEPSAGQMWMSVVKCPWINVRCRRTSYNCSLFELVLLCWFVHPFSTSLKVIMYVTTVSPGSTTFHSCLKPGSLAEWICINVHYFICCLFVNLVYSILGFLLLFVQFSANFVLNVQLRFLTILFQMFWKYVYKIYFLLIAR